jgi:hypothetical protein
MSKTSGGVMVTVPLIAVVDMLTGLVGIGMLTGVCVITSVDVMPPPLYSCPV